MKVSRERIERLLNDVKGARDPENPSWIKAALRDAHCLCEDLLADLDAEESAKVEKIKECQ